MSAELELAQRILTAIVTKLELTKWDTVVRRHGVGIPWIELAICPIGKEPERFEHGVSRPETSFKVETNEQRNYLAQMFLKEFAMMTGKLKPKDV